MNNNPKKFTTMKRIIFLSIVTLFAISNYAQIETYESTSPQNTITFEEVQKQYPNLSEEEQKLAYIIGILHDIGRFRQIKLYNTYSDQKSKISHAKLGTEILFDENKIYDFIDVRDYDSIIKTAILNHSILKIEDGSMV